MELWTPVLGSWVFDKLVNTAFPFKLLVLFDSAIPTFYFASIFLQSTLNKVIMSHFKLLSSTKASDVIPVNKYISEKTGLKVIIADVEGPLVKGFFSLGTFFTIFYFIN